MGIAQSAETGWWAHWPLSRYFTGITVIVLLCLALVLSLSLRQFLLYRQCQQAVTASDRLLFQFTAFKDHLNETVLLAQPIDVRQVNDELQQLGEMVESLTTNILVPPRMKAELPSRADWLGFETRLRALRTDAPDNGRARAELIRSLNTLHVELQQFRFLLTDHTQAMLIGLHRTIAGSLILIAAVSCTLLYLVNQHLARPIIQLCRLVTPADMPTLPEEPCSLAALTVRIRTLAAGTPVPAPPPLSESERRHTLSLTEEALRYRYSVAGALSVELASELINHINGIMNYTQTLVDVSKGQGTPGQLDNLSRSLLREEKKTTGLVAALQRMGQWQLIHPPQVVLGTIFAMMTTMLGKSLHSEGIRLELPDQCETEATIPAGDLWLVFMTVLHHGRTALNQNSAGAAQQGAEKRLTMELSPLDRQAKTQTIMITNSGGLWADAPDGLVWPSLSFCARLMHARHATLTLAPGGDTSRIFIDLPCIISVS